MSNPVVVIGCNSFSGANFVRHLLLRGIEVIGVSRSVQPDHAFLPYLFQPVPKSRFQFCQFDLNHQQEELELMLDRLKPKKVFNFAAQSMVAQSWDNPEHWYQTNLLATTRLHDILRQKDYLARYIHVSTPEVYGSLSGFVSENRMYHPSTPYAISRAAADMSLHAYFEAYQFPVVYTRAANVYGPGQQLYRIIPKTILSIRSGKKLPLHGGGHSERSFIHMDDVSDATWKIAEKGILGDIYHISGEHSVTIRALVENICSLLGADFSSSVLETGDRLGKDSAYLLDASKLRETLDWSDRISLDQGLGQTVEWVDKHYNVLSAMTWDYVHKR